MTRTICVLAFIELVITLKMIIIIHFKKLIVFKFLSSNPSIKTEGKAKEMFVGSLKNECVPRKFEISSGKLRPLFICLSCPSALSLTFLTLFMLWEHVISLLFHDCTFGFHHFF